VGVTREWDPNPEACIDPIAAAIDPTLGAGLEPKQQPQLIVSDPYASSVLPLFIWPSSCHPVAPLLPSSGEPCVLLRHQRVRFR
jgi:hypothetical protein